MKTKIEINHWMTGSILFEFEKENNTLTAAQAAITRVLQGNE